MDSKLLLLPTALMIAGNSAAEAKGKKSDKRPNILVIMADDLGTAAILHVRQSAGCFVAS